MLHKSSKLAVLSIIALGSMSACFADDTNSSSTTVSTPAGTSSTAVHSRVGSDGTSATHVRSATQDANGISAHHYKSVAGPGGTAQSASHTNIHVNGAGGITTSKAKSASATSADGTATVQHAETKTSTP